MQASDPSVVPTRLVVLIRDLIFSSKVRAAGKGLEGIVFVREASKLETTDGSRLIVDLNQPGHLEAALAWKKRTAGHVTAFVAHVAAEQIAQARAMGVDQLLSNGAFSQQIDRILRE